MSVKKKTKNGTMAASLGSDVRMGQKDLVKKGDKIFKVPDVPLRSGCGHSGPDGEDVFGAIGLNGLAGDKNGGKGKGKGKDVLGTKEEDNVVGEIEIDNKMLIKQSAVHALSFHGITKQHEEFKELFGFVYRGAMFALVRLFCLSFIYSSGFLASLCRFIIPLNLLSQRKKVKVATLDTRTVDRIVEAHVGMYVSTVGG